MSHASDEPFRASDQGSASDNDESWTADPVTADPHEDRSVEAVVPRSISEESDPERPDDEERPVGARVRPERPADPEAEAPESAPDAPTVPESVGPREPDPIERPGVGHPAQDAPAPDPAGRTAEEAAYTTELEQGASHRAADGSGRSED